MLSATIPQLKWYGKLYSKHAKMKSHYVFENRKRLDINVIFCRDIRSASTLHVASPMMVTGEIELHQANKHPTLCPYLHSVLKKNSLLHLLDVGPQIEDIFEYRIEQLVESFENGQVVLLKLFINFWKSLKHNHIPLWRQQEVYHIYTENRTPAHTWTILKWIENDKEERGKRLHLSYGNEQNKHDFLLWSRSTFWQNVPTRKSLKLLNVWYRGEVWGRHKFVRFDSRFF